MRVVRAVAALGAVLLIAACVSGAGLYRPATSARGSGYSEQRIETNRWRVTFTGGPSTPASVVEDFALLRAADLTLSMGYEWFTVAGRETVPQTSNYGPRYSGMFGPPCGAFGCRSAIYGGFWYDDFDENRLSASLDIVMGKGAKPADANTYDARDVASTIRARSAAPAVP